MFKRLILKFLLISCFYSQLSAQSDTLTLTLADAIKIAQDSSLQAFRAATMYLASHYQYDEFVTQGLPTVNFSTTPFSYNRSITRQFSTQDSAFHFYETQSINSSANLSIAKILTSTGGTVTLTSNIDRLKNSGSAVYYSTAPVSIGFQQSLFAVNDYKWRKKLAPLEFEIAKKTFINSREDIAASTVDYFFSLLIAEKQLALVRKSITDADTMYWIGEKRFENGSIEKTDLLTLKLDLINKKAELKTRLDEYENARFEFLSYINLPPNKSIKLIVPSKIPEIILDYEQVLQLAKTNNIEYMNLALEEIQAKSALERGLKGSRFNASIGASFGFNKSSEDFKKTLDHPNSQQQLNLNVTVPVIDWGRAKHTRNKAIRTFKESQYQQKEGYLNLEHQFKLNTNTFNLQREVIESAEYAQKIADEAYEIAQKRFSTGRIDVNAISMQRSRKENANLNYLSQIQQYWSLFYKMRKNTLFDFEKKISLTKDFDELNKIE